ncbi:AraC family transcriptional regulator [Leptospira sp. 201903070]|uniref:AraC family transcriptional regulator n=1 Tax=Leptospira ainlahdjerensis TaxID=2810033 RepID=A0ABS2UCX7_9LEPT|nr:helix-turn-helix domain-containing protein [Leptospira ainlahdjerensis]MBM9577097.1 AraC family transcriptional regulator [Leptospira ainlahdjerensis]
MVYLIIILMIAEKIIPFFQIETNGFIWNLSEIIYIVSPIFLFNNLIFFQNERHKTDNTTTQSEEQKLMKSNYYITNVVLKGIDIEAINNKLYNLLEKEKIFFDEDIRLPSVAEEMGISTHVLSAFINHHLNTNFNTLINYYRIKEAISLLKEEPGRTAMSVGLAVGFNSNSTFQRSFLHFTKMSPSKYREQIRNGYDFEIDPTLRLDYNDPLHAPNSLEPA